LSDNKKFLQSQVRAYKPTIPALWWLKHEDQEFKANLGYINKTLSQKQTHKNKKTLPILGKQFLSLSSLCCLLICLLKCHHYGRLIFAILSILI
jgi:hypothetical protein